MFVARARGGDLSLVFGHRRAHGELPVEEGTLMPAGELVRPLVALAALKAGDGPNATIKLDGLELPTGLRMGHLLAMSSGAAVSKTGYASPNSAAPGLDAYLRSNLTWRNQPGSAYLPSFVNYGLVQKVLAGGSDTKLQQVLAASVFVPFDLAGTVLVPAKDTNSSGGVVRSGKYYFDLSDGTAVPGANRLFVSARDYARFLLGFHSANPDAGLFRPAFAYGELFGGSTYGLTYLRARSGKILYRIESQIPGSAGAALLIPGQGAIVVLATPSEPAFVRDCVAIAQAELFKEHFLPEEILVPKKPIVYPRKPTFTPVPTAGLEKSFGELAGFYRPVQALPIGEQLLAFLNDTRVAITARHGLELSGVFRQDAAVRLIPIGTDLFFAHGNAPMHGWRVQVERKEGKVVGLLSDGMRYRRVPLLFSIWSVMIGLGLLIVLPTLGAIIFLVRRRPVDKS